ncbi:hypothetical protein ACQ4LE_009309, partial [Meloidogyne hapla]
MSDHELELVLEYSRQTYLKEQAERKEKEEKSEEDVDLMIIENPEVLEKDRKIKQIKQMLYAKKEPVDSYQNGPLSPVHYLPQSPCFIQPQYTGQIFPFVSTAKYSNQQFQLPSTSTAIHFEQQFLPSNSFSVPNSPDFWSNNFIQPTPLSVMNSNLLNPLAIQTDVNTPEKNSSNSSSSLKIPFQNGDLIDLQSPMKASSLTIEEFDPLYKKLQKSEMENEEKAQENVNSNIKKEIKNNSEDNSNKCVDEPPAYKSNKIQPQQHQQRLLCCDDFNTRQELACDFYKEKQLLYERSPRIRTCSKNENQLKDVFFLAPVLDYFVTPVDTIKLHVHQDDTWPRDTPEELQSFELACAVKKTSDEILLEVLLRLLSQEDIQRNEGQIPLNDYALKVFGTDEFLVPDAPIGKNLFVAQFLAGGKDVDLEVGRKIL